MEYIFVAIFWLVPVLIGFFFGRHIEAKHYQSIHEREKQLLQLPTTANKAPLERDRLVQRSELAFGSVVVSIDYFKRFLAGLRTIVGGPVTSYESLLDRARREAVLRLKESCPGADEIVNLRLETAPINDGAKQSVSCVEVLAYGTAIYFQPAR